MLTQICCHMASMGHNELTLMMDSDSIPWTKWQSSAPRRRPVMRPRSDHMRDMSCRAGTPWKPCKTSIFRENILFQWTIYWFDCLYMFTTKKSSQFSINAWSVRRIYLINHAEGYQCGNVSCGILSSWLYARNQVDGTSIILIMASSIVSYFRSPRCWKRSQIAHVLHTPMLI